MKMIWKKALIIVTILGTVLTGCKKDDFLLDAEAADDDNKVATIEDDNTLASDFIATENVTGGRTESTEGNRFLGAANVSFDPITNIITVDFGTTNVLCSDGKNRRGKIYIKIEEGRPTNLPYTSVLTHENYFVNDNKVEGTRRERKIALSSTSTQTDITVTNRKVSFTDGTVLTKNVNHIRVKTVSTDGIMYATTGTSNGTNRRGKNYTTTILTPIISKTSCNNYLFPIQGTMNLGVNGDDTKFLLDFGNGTCDRTFTVTYNGRTKTITR